MKKTPYFNKTEERILRILYQQKAVFTTYEVAKEAKISFPTALKYLRKLAKGGYIQDLKDDKKTERSN